MNSKEGLLYYIALIFHGRMRFWPRLPRVPLYQRMTPLTRASLCHVRMYSGFDYYEDDIRHGYIDNNSSLYMWAR